ncbi:uncharacterized protein METZ01_LOCUS402454 [marine metagenome]|uniref:NADH-Ubiquinone oxidoreductase (complex I) chain 5 N-terminal domain-containing protein n=1 Tax=marine metagenome TaxID=408172 RepID=A0A382VTA6_9ZZZZ
MLVIIAIVASIVNFYSLDYMYGDAH